MSHEMIAILMFSSMMMILMTGQRVFGVIGGVAAIAAVTLWGVGGSDLPFSSAMKLMKWYPLLTLPMFIFMGYVLSESRIADRQATVNRPHPDMEHAIEVIGNA